MVREVGGGAEEHDSRARARSSDSSANFISTTNIRLEGAWLKPS